MRVLVTGGRDFQDASLAYREMDRLNARCEICELIHGGAKGADQLAAVWARDNDISETIFKPEWNRYGRGAAVRANQDMVDSEPDLVLVFPGGKGTQDMVRRATSAGLTIEYANDSSAD